MLEYCFAQYLTLFFKKLIFSIDSSLTRLLRERVFFILGRNLCYANAYIYSKRRESLFLSLMLFFFCATPMAQVFQQTEDEFTIDHSYLGGYLGGGVSTFDFNNDGLDDLTMPSGESGSTFLLNNGATFVAQEFIILTTSVRSIIWVDYDNDGDNDISLTEHAGLFRLFTNDGDFNFEEVDFGIADNTPTFNSGISWGDYDNDGLLDAYITRYPTITLEDTEDKTNLLIKNLGNDLFLDVTDDLDVGNGIKHSFISTWVDLDNDNDLDLYVVNDRFEFPNATFLNNSDGTFTEVTAINGADLAVLAMTSTIDDYDNDSDFDIYCTNTFAGNHLLQNDGSGMFTDLFGNIGPELFRFSWGANWIDFQNNGWKDLFVSVGEFNNDNSNAFFSNNQTGGFNNLSSIVLDTESRDSHGCAKGDFNNDGLYDLVISNEAPDYSRVLLNHSGTTNNHIKVTLEGVYSNKNAVGSKIHAFVNGSVQTYFTTCGSNYISQDSQHMIIGMAQNEQVDSLTITWPSGLRETHYNIPHGSSPKFLEGETIQAHIISSEGFSICPGETITLELDINSISVTWNDSDITSSLEITEAGDYWAYCNLADGVNIPTDTITITESNSASLEASIITDVSCFGVDNGEATFHFSTTQGDSVFDHTISELYSGYYNHIIHFEGLCNAQLEYSINQPPPIFTEITSIDYPCFEEDLGSVVATSFGGVLPYEYGPLDSLTYGVNVINTTDANGCNYSFDFYLDMAPETFIELIITPQTDDDLGSVDVTNPTTEYAEYIIQDDFLNPVNGTELTAGNYTITYWNIHGCEIQENFTVEQLNSVSLQSESINSRLFPNPTNGAVKISNCKNVHEVLIYSYEGRLVKKLGISESCTLEVSDLDNGTYILSVQYNDYENINLKLSKN